MTAPYQTQVNTVPGVAVAGDRASANPNLYSFLAGPGGLVAGASGVTVGYWGWTSTQGMDPDNAPTVVNNFGGPAAPNGFVAREEQGLNTTYLSDASQLVPTGFGVTLYTRGDFWVKNDGTTAATIGQKVFADMSTGKSSFAAAGAATTASISASIAAATTASLTGSVVGNVLTVTALASGTIGIGGLLYGTVGGSGVTAGTFISAQISGTANGTGVYSLTKGEQQTGSGTLSVSYGVLTVGTLTSGTIGLNGSVGAAGVSANTIITQYVSGSGAGAIYYVNNTQSVGAGTSMTVGNTVETGFYALSAGQAGELIKISRDLNAG